MYKLSEMFGQRGGSDAFGRRAVKNIGIRTDIGQTFAETGTTSTNYQTVPSTNYRVPYQSAPSTSYLVPYQSVHMTNYLVPTHQYLGPTT